MQCAVENTHHPTNQLLARAVISYWSHKVSEALNNVETELKDIALSIEQQTDASKSIDSFQNTVAELAPYGIASRKDLQDMISLLKNNNKTTDNTEGTVILASALFCVANDTVKNASWCPTKTFDIELLFVIHEFFEKSIALKSTTSDDTTKSS